MIADAPSAEAIARYDVPPRAKLVIRAFAAFDLLVTGCLALPILDRWLVGLLFDLNAALGGSADVPSIPPIGWLFLNLAGVLGVLWALPRLFAPTRLVAIADTIGRGLVALWIVWHVWRGAPGILLAFVATELAGAGLQARALREPRLGTTSKPEP